MTTNLNRDFIEPGACMTYNHANKPFKFDGLFSRRLRKPDSAFQRVEVIGATSSRLCTGFGGASYHCSNIHRKLTDGLT